jgi:hypothetical protein
MMKFDTYTIQARFFPALVSSVPIFILWYFIIREPDWKGFLEFILSMRFLGGISFSLIFLYFYSQFIRITSKYFERKYFTAAKGFPTTYFMCYDDQTYSSDYKDKFRERVRKTLKLQPFDAAEEKVNPAEARSRITECFNHIRLKIGDGKLVLKHNIWYGFSRNLIGGAIYGVIFCTCNIITGFFLLKAVPLAIASLLLLIIYLSILAFRRAIMFQNAEAYARQLISEFMSITTPRR